MVETEVMFHEHQWVRQGGAAGAYSEALWGPPTCTVCGATHRSEPDCAVMLHGHRLTCPRLSTVEYALDCNACPYYRGLGGPPGRGYVRCAWGQA